MNIRPRTDADAEYIFAAGNQLLKMHTSIDPFYTAIAEADRDAELIKERLGFIAEVEKVTVGYVAGVFFPQPVDRSYPFALLQQLWVEESHRAGGIGKQLVEAFEAAAGERGAKQVDINVDIRNILGRNF